MKRGEAEGIATARARLQKLQKSGGLGALTDVELALPFGTS